MTKNVEREICHLCRVCFYIEQTRFTLGFRKLVEPTIFEFSIFSQIFYLTPLQLILSCKP